MTPTQAKIEAFEEAKRIIEGNRYAVEFGAVPEEGAHHLARLTIEDIDREILLLRKAKPQATPSTPKDDYRDFSGFGT